MTAWAALQDGRQDGESEEPLSTQKSQRTRWMPVFPMLVHEVPWRVAVPCVLSVAVAAIGAWLLFQDYQIALGPRYTNTFMLCSYDGVACKAQIRPRPEIEKRHGWCAVPQSQV